MSGTSLDGLDLALIEFSFNVKWNFRLLQAVTIPYPVEWKKKLSHAHLLTGSMLMALHVAYGRYLGIACNTFRRNNRLSGIDFVASHGHTIFHQPENGFTFQLGDGNTVHAETGLPVVFDFRSLDVALGGQGAPLVPIGDKQLFSAYDVCLNLGGIANLSMEVKGERKAFDICFCNMALNFLMSSFGKPFDENGRMAAKGSVDMKMLKAISARYESIRAKRPSIGREFFEQQLVPIFSKAKLNPVDSLRTICESITREISSAIPISKKKSRMLLTGGGALNSFLVNLLKDKVRSKVEVVIPSNEIIEFKEAILFGFLGVLRVRNEINTLRSVTKAQKDSCGGTVVGM